MSQVNQHELGTAGRELTPDEREELEQLRREVGDLRAKAPPQAAPPRRGRWRSVVAVLLIVLGCVLAPLALVAVWTDRTISDNDRFVETVAPLADDPAVQQRITDRITETIFDNVDVQTLADDAITGLSDLGLPAGVTDRLRDLTPTLQSAVEGFVRDRVDELVTSQRFADTFEQVVRLAHQQAVEVLSDQSSTIVVQNGQVVLDLAPFIDLAKQRLSDRGLTIVERIPEVHPTIAIADADQLVRAQTAYSTLNSVASVLPWVVLLLLAAGVFLARRRLRALVGAGLGVALALLVLAIGLLVARSLLVNAVPSAAAPAAASSFDTLVRFLRDGGRLLFVLALVVALGAFLAGSSPSAVGIRRWSSARLQGIRGGPSPSGRVGTWTRAHLRGLRVGALALAVLVFLFVSEPSGVTIVVIAAVLLLVLAVLEVLGRPERPEPAEPPAEPAVPEAAGAPAAPAPRAAPDTREPSEPG